jgi:hypothetical protein
MFRQDPGLFNEDVGETALSILAQHTARMRLTELHQVDKLFQEISLMTAAVDQFSHFKSSNDTQSSSFLIDLASQDISQTVSFLNRLVTTLKLGVAKQYDEACMYDEKDAVARSHKAEEVVRFSSFDFIHILRECPALGTATNDLDLNVGVCTDDMAKPPCGRCGFSQ